MSGLLRAFLDASGQKRPSSVAAAVPVRSPSNGADDDGLPTDEEHLVTAVQEDKQRAAAASRRSREHNVEAGQQSSSNLKSSDGMRRSNQVAQASKPSDVDDAEAVRRADEAAASLLQEVEQEQQRLHKKKLKAKAKKGSKSKSKAHACAHPASPEAQPSHDGASCLCDWCAIVVACHPLAIMLPCIEDEQARPGSCIAVVGRFMRGMSQPHSIVY